MSMSQRGFSLSSTRQNGDANKDGASSNKNTVKPVYPASAQRGRSVREQIAEIEKQYAVDDNDQYDLTPLDHRQDEQQQQRPKGDTPSSYSIDPFEFSGGESEEPKKLAATAPNEPDE